MSAIRSEKVLSALAVFILVVLAAILGESGSPPASSKNGGLPDLTASGLTAPASSAPGASIQVSANVSNIGTATSKSFSVLFSLVPGTDPTGAGTSLTTVAMVKLKGGATTLILTNLTLPASTLPGSYLIRLTVDSANQITESDETNNVLAVPITIQPPTVTLEPSIDTTQLDVPWPMHSHYKQPWRAWLETIPGQVYRDGVGIDYNWNLARASQDVEMQFLAASGFSRIRVEIGWGNVDYNTLDLNPSAKTELTAIVTAAKAHGIRPLILLNAHHGVPVPALQLNRTVAVSTAQGSPTLQLNDVTGIVVGYTGISNLTQYKMAEVIITAIDTGTRTVSLSKPLPVNLSAGQALTLHTLKYLPLYEVGMPQYEDTAAGWLQYVRAIANTLVAAGVTNFDVEIWNELSFGSDFLGINNYYDPAIVTVTTDFLWPGGRAHELANRTGAMLAAEFLGVVPIWGFSNTTFFHTPVSELPTRTLGQSYHPFFFIDYQSIADEENGFADNLEGFAPQAPPYRGLLPEGAGVFLKTESLLRLINPTARTTLPSGSPSFAHMMTEYGFDPAGKGVTDVSQAELLKAKTVLRGSLFWLNKGLSAIWFFTDINWGNQLEYDLLPSTIASLTSYPSDPSPYMTPAMTALKNVATLFQASVPLLAPRQLDVEIAAADGSGGGLVFSGDSTHPALTNQDVFTVLPFQIDDDTFLLATYVMTRNILASFQPVSFVVKISNVNGTNAKVSYYDPMSGGQLAVQVAERTAISLTLTLPVTDYPYLLRVEE